MLTQTVSVPQRAFFGDSQLDLEFPRAWEVVVKPMSGWDAPALTADQMRAALAKPYGTAPLRELAKGKREAVIIFDDMSRPTPTSVIWPLVVEELHAAGMVDDQIRFIVALGMHGAHSREDFVRKLGEEALRRFPVYNHNPYEHVTYVGDTRQGTPVEVNNEVMACDLRIGIGSILPHPFAGFGGGPKLILPGVVSYRTITHNHGPLQTALRQGGAGPILLPGFSRNPIWLDMADAARLAGLDFKVDAILNGHRQVVGLYAGDFEAEWDEGVKLAKRVYSTEPVPDADIVVSNAYGKANEGMISAWSPNQTIGKPKDQVVIITSPQGTVVHYLLGDFGSKAVGTLARSRALPPNVDRLMVYTPYPERSAKLMFSSVAGDIQVTEWSDVIRRLSEKHPGSAKVAVYPDMTVQYIPSAGAA